MGTFTSDKQTLSEFLKSVEQAKLQLPDFQRGWVWDDERIKSLLASVSREFPIGAVMMLEAGGDARFQSKPIEGVSEQDVQPDKLLLDGQQRLTSLYQALRLKRPIETKDVRNRPIQRLYYIDIEASLDPGVDREEAIIGVGSDGRLKMPLGREYRHDFSTREKEYENKVFPLNHLFEDNQWMMGWWNYWDQDTDKMDLFLRFKNQVLSAFQGYELPLILLKKETPKEAVCLVFEKVNTGGVSLSAFELVTATFAADGFQLREDWCDTRHHSGRYYRITESQNGHLLKDLGPTEFLQAVTLLYSYAKNREEAAQGNTPPPVSCTRPSLLRLPLEGYKQHCEAATKGFIDVPRFLYSEKIFTSRDIPYDTQLVPLAAILGMLGERWLDNDVRKKLRRWFWCGVLGELYGSSVETRFAKDLPQVLDWIDGGPEPETVQVAHFYAERLYGLKTRNSAAYKGLHALIMRFEAKDFVHGEKIDEATYFNESIEIHHIFPRAWCKQQQKDEKFFESILNKTAISARANRTIGSNAPSRYVPQLEKRFGFEGQQMDHVLQSHLIDPDDLRNDDFEGMIQNRRKQILQMISQAMGKDVVSGTDAEGGKEVVENEEETYMSI